MYLTRRQFDRLYRGFLVSDARWDGRVWVAVRTTGIYCVPSCRARKPRPQNVRFYFSPAEAEGAGFRPCRKCRPDVHGGRRAIERAALRAWLAELAESEAPMENLARGRGVSPSGLYRLFRRHLGYGPRRARTQARLDRACHLLRERRATVAEVAYEAGFGSLATFYRWFRRAVGVTPTRFRRQIKTARTGESG